MKGLFRVKALLDIKVANFPGPDSKVKPPIIMAPALVTVQLFSGFRTVPVPEPKLNVVRVVRLNVTMLAVD